MGGILFHRINRIHQFTACFAIKQAGKQNGLVKGWFHQNRFAFHMPDRKDYITGKKKKTKKSKPAKKR